MRIQTTGRLVFRPMPMDGEGLNGFLLRLSEGNGLAGIREFLKRGKGEITALADRLGIAEDHKELRSITCQSQNEGITSLPLWNNNTSRYCPECLREEKIWRRQWEMSLMTACPHHQCTLVSYCQACDSSLTWARHTSLSCKCGHGLLGQKAGNASEHEASLAKWFLEKLNGSNEVPDYLRLLNIRQLHRLVVFLGAYALPSNGKKRLKITGFTTFATAHALTTAAAPILATWPEGFHQLLDKIFEGKNTDDAGSRLPARFGAFYKYLFREFREKEFGPLIYAFEDYVGQHWKGALTKRNRCLSPALVRNHYWVPVNALAKELNTSRGKLVRLYNQGKFDAHLVKSAKGRKTLCIDRSQVPLIKGLLNDLIDLKTSCEILGIPDNRVLQLTHHYMLGRGLCPEKEEYGQWGFSRKMIEFMPHFGGQFEPSPESEHPDMVSLAFALQYWLKGNSIFPRLVMDVLTEQILPKAFSVEKTGMGAWLFDRVELRTWISDFRKGLRRGGMSVDQAAKRLGIQQEFAYQLVRSGYLYAEKEEDTQQQIISNGAFDEFMESYVLTKEIAQKIGLAPPSRVSKYLESYDFRAIGGPGTCRPMRQYLYERTDRLVAFMEAHS